MNQDLMTAKAKLNYMVNLENENEGYSKSVKGILDYAKTNSKVHGTIANIISTDEKYEYAVEIALGGFIQNIVVEDELIAKNLITYPKYYNDHYFPWTDDEKEDTNQMVRVKVFKEDFLRLKKNLEQKKAIPYQILFIIWSKAQLSENQQSSLW